MKSLLSAALLGAAIIAGPAYAQTMQPAPANPPAAATTTTPATGDKMMLKDSWRASKLIGLDVYNEANEKLGDINELIVDKNGKISAVVIGVGGFLGMGEHDIAVTMDKLKFVEEAVRTSSTSSAPATTTTTTPPASTSAERRESTTGAATTTTTTTATRDTTKTNDWVPDHAVMSGTKEQLKAMPQFKYSDYN
jgi:sporulation protein YlmC with PRC-barrel domain